MANAQRRLRMYRIDCVTSLLTAGLLAAGLAFLVRGPLRDSVEGDRGVIVLSGNGTASTARAILQLPSEGRQVGLSFDLSVNAKGDLSSYEISPNEEWLPHATGRFTVTTVRSIGINLGRITLPQGDPRQEAERIARSYRLTVQISGRSETIDLASSRPGRPCVRMGGLWRLIGMPCLGV